MAKTQIHTSMTHTGSITSYIIGFVLSVALTLGAYYLVVNHVLDGTKLLATIVGLAIAQLIVQLIFFLHMNKEAKPRWNLMVFSFMVLVVFIVVIGSIWVMYNLDYNMMPKEELEQHMIHESEKGF